VDIGFIGLGHMGFQMARRLVDAKHRVVVFDTRPEVGTSVKDVADRVETVRPACRRCRLHSTSQRVARGSSAGRG
jgi:3-hydroxyisobutyrate dehydrogenase-like beta-hydroxyacid dehydrogenase